MKQLIMVVDDLELNRTILREILEDYEIVEASSAQECLDMLAEMRELPQAVLLDIIMPGMDGFACMRRIKQEKKTADIPVLIVTNVNAADNESFGLKNGATDYISRPFNPDVVRARVAGSVQLYRQNADLEKIVDRKTAEVTKTHERIMEVMATIIEYRSDESSAHIMRTNALCAALVEHLLKDPRFLDHLIRCDYETMIRAMSLHDIGKVAIPDHILLKPARLAPEEFEVIKRHTVIGHRLIATICSGMDEVTPYLRHCMDICRYHHERWDGSGYPDGLVGNEIPLSARILSVVDVFDALCSPRCYKPAYPYEQSIEMIVEGRGTQFDPRIVDAMLAVKEHFIEIHEAMADTVLDAPMPVVETAS